MNHIPHGLTEPPPSSHPSSEATTQASTEEWAADRRDFVADDRQQQADQRDGHADRREALADQREQDLDRRAVTLDAADCSSENAGVGLTRAAGRLQRAKATDARTAAGVDRRVADSDRDSVRGAHPLAAEFLKMATSLLRADTVELAMDDVVDAAVRFVNGCDAASFSAYVDDVAMTLASTGPLADDLDAAQYRSSDGPCLQAIRTLKLVVSADLARDARWPDVVWAAAQGEVRSVMSLPVEGDRGRDPFGSLNHYGREVNAFDGEDAETAMLLTAHLGVLLHLATTIRDAASRAEQLGAAVTSRDVIGQAKGILMEREHLTAAQAFDVLRGASQRLNRKLREVADELASSGELPVGPGRPTAGRRPHRG